MAKRSKKHDIGLLEQELVKASKAGFIDSILPIAANSSYCGFHVYFKASMPSSKINQVIDYVKNTHEISAYFDPRQNYCQFYILKKNAKNKGGSKL